MTTRDTPHLIAPQGRTPFPDAKTTVQTLGNSQPLTGLFANPDEQRAPEV
ncbi:hypothetical protein [Tropicimonas isoalkanivorans]|uniref:Uncharacterized protein n=1 Tax=Tropicimonas isoalkanivorans TaxID=441112 RepID=A0A1I1QED5_9RHOB|nr:hypothetical protein [Tropicimonas isoalkanivorans]SFD17593.1 hypothetical protein SAMN04488094_11866 [Tropicimonas isoalkanivorans]